MHLRRIGRSGSDRSDESKTSHRGLARIEHFLLSVITHVLDAAEVVDDRAPAWLLSAWSSPTRISPAVRFSGRRSCP